jgi:hypothetical protein
MLTTNAVYRLFDGGLKVIYNYAFGLRYSRSDVETMSESTQIPS